ncbi:hypothetical protein KKI98_23475, partial [Xenorhabdus bovienii]
MADLLQKFQPTQMGQPTSPDYTHTRRDSFPPPALSGLRDYPDTTILFRRDFFFNNSLLKSLF